MLSRNISVLLLFSFFLVYFVFGSGWYAPAQLIAKGIAADHSADIQVKWDSGEGYNDYESARFSINTFAGNDTGLHRVTIRALGEKHPQSAGKAVEITGVYVDGNAFDLSEILPETIMRDRKAYHLQKKGERLSFEVRADKAIRIELATGDYFGKVEVTVDGVAAIHDLYISVPRIDILKLNYWVVASGGQFSVTMDLPRYPIHELAISNTDQNKRVSLSSVLLHSSLGDRELLGSRDADALFSTVLFADINTGLKQYFHPYRFLLQLLFAGLTTWGVIACFNFYRQIGGMRKLFVARQRYVFWLFLLCAMLCYSFWLVAFWPGIMSIDSLKIWRAAALPGVFLHDHPVLNVIFYTYLMQIWNNVAVVPVVHIGLTALLVAYLFFFLFRQGVALFLLIPCYLLAVFSLPIGLYSIALWKDIPFALLVTFWAFTLVRLRIKSRTGKLHLSLSSILALMLLYVSLGMFRYNG
ncbi:MAG: hypothetical protein JRF04_02625, partial [Deltaproteobacteria bacterium]|nr:hypothetical protein [Deltaproteobacteria bacterium]